MEDLVPAWRSYGLIDTHITMAHRMMRHFCFWDGCMALSSNQLFISSILIIALAACGAPPTPLPTVSPTQGVIVLSPISTPAETSLNLPIHADWQIQYSGEIELSLDVKVYNLDLFEVTPEDIASLHARGIYVMCYFSAGSWEDWRPDASLFPEEIIGNDYEGWPGEKWLDVRAINSLAPVMEARFSLAAEKGCDGVDPDNVNGFENETGFPISYADQLNYNLWLSETANRYGLDIGLKNDLSQIHDLLPHFDWALNEECFTYSECELLLPFYEAGKPVFVIEYETTPVDFCQKANELGFNAIYKNWELDAYREVCP